MNQYTSDGSAIISSNGAEYAIGVPHTLPVPPGIFANDWKGGLVLFGPNELGEWDSTPTRIGNERPTHWFATGPLPEIPKPKTQEELDGEAFTQWVNTCGHQGLHVAWVAAIAYARKGQQ